MKRFVIIALALLAGFAASAQNTKVENSKKAKYSSIYDMIRMQPGVVINNSGDTPSITIRGIGTNSNATQPTFLIDGIQSTASQLNSLNPDDVWSVEVVKDGSAGFYGGMESANGVILIETNQHHELLQRQAEEQKAAKQAAREARKSERKKN